VVECASFALLCVVNYALSGSLASGGVGEISGRGARSLAARRPAAARAPRSGGHFVRVGAGAFHPPRSTPLCVIARIGQAAGGGRAPKKSLPRPRF
jgi:hypothetical protein